MLRMPVFQSILGFTRFNQENPKMIDSFPSELIRNRVGIMVPSSKTFSHTEWVICPKRLGVPSTLNTVMGRRRRVV